MTSETMKIGEARKILLDNEWTEGAIKRALNPTPRQARERAFIPIANVNPEQHAAIRALHLKGWGAHDIGLVIPVPEAEIARVLIITGWEPSL